MKNTPGIIVLDESERRRPSILEVHKRDLAVLQEKILDVLLTTIRRKISDVETTLGATHSICNEATKQSNNKRRDSNTQENATSE